MRLAETAVRVCFDKLIGTSASHLSRASLKPDSVGTPTLYNFLPREWCHSQRANPSTLINIIKIIPYRHALRATQSTLSYQVSLDKTKLMKLTLITIIRITVITLTTVTTTIMITRSRPDVAEFTFPWTCFPDKKTETEKVNQNQSSLQQLITVSSGRAGRSRTWCFPNTAELGHVLKSLKYKTTHM